MKPKENNKDTKRDQCFTPPYAVKPLLDLLNIPKDMLVWENAPGEGNLTNELLLNDINTYTTMTSLTLIVSLTIVV